MIGFNAVELTININGTPLIGRNVRIFAAQEPKIPTSGIDTGKPLIAGWIAESLLYGIGLSRSGRISTILHMIERAEELPRQGERDKARRIEFIERGALRKDEFELVCQTKPVATKPWINSTPWKRRGQSKFIR